MSPPRKFDHDEARRLRAEGWSYGALARRFDVSDTAVCRVCNDARREQMHRTARAWQREHWREPCLGCGKLVWSYHPQNKTGLCRTCLGAQVAAEGIRPDELLCRKCDTWKSDEEFTATPGESRRGRRTHCRTCETAQRTKWRQSNREQERKSDRERKRRKREAV